MVTLPNSTQIPVSLCGDFQLSPDLILKEVLFILKFKFNLIYVAAITNDSQLTINFFPDHFMIQELNNKKTIGKGNKLEDLYVLNIDSLGNGSETNHLRSSLTVSSICINTVTTRVWHNRLEHLSSQRLDVLKNQYTLIVQNVIVLILVMFVHWLNKEDCHLFLIITCLNLLLN